MTRTRRNDACSARLAAVLVAVSAACAGPTLRPIRDISSADEAAAPRGQEEAWPAAPEFVDGDEWIRLGSGEWLKGELETLTRDVLAFDSDELGSLSLDWADVAEVVTTRPFTVVRDDRAVAVGAVRIVDDTVYVRTEGGIVRFPRSQLMRMLRKVEGRANWSGRVRLSATRQSGNTDQTDTSFHADATGRTANTRTSLSFDHVFSEVDSSRTADNQTFRGAHDVYVSPRFFLTPLGVELFRDPFQNVALRASPYAGAGYGLVDEARQQWDVNGGVGYRYTRFDSVEAGEDEERGTGTLVFGTDYDLQLTSSVELEASYQVDASLEDTADTNQEASALLTFDFIWDLDFDVRLVWKRVGAPEADEDGTTPEKDDFRVDVGLSWEF